ncbi:MAG: carbohydrate ABC transporter permease [Roseiflexaceae bacterium]
MVGERGLARIGWLTLFLAPGLSGLLVFTIGPLLASLALTLFTWDLLTPPRFVGLGNFARLIADRSFWAALRHTLAFIAGYVPLVTILALGLALALNIPRRGIAAIRTMFFLPVVSSWVAVALLWSWLFNPKYGLINYLLGLLGLARLAVRPKLGHAGDRAHKRLERPGLCAGAVPGQPAGDPQRLL